mmetsp:Transcript_37088/g.80083  ORF Transcript_37088/g.80083 Transcript_37088/m.80083 type:complete len:202 (+) Transcript_37088:22-627(+)
MHAKSAKSTSISLARSLASPRSLPNLISLSLPSSNSNRTFSLFPPLYPRQSLSSLLSPTPTIASPLAHPTAQHTLSPKTMTSLTSTPILTTIGVLLILHSTYSCLHYRSLAIAADLPNTSSPPLDVVIEVILGFALCLIGQLLCGPFHEVRVVSSGGGGSLLGRSIQKKSRGEIIAPAYRTRDFDLFTTRAKALSMAKRTN